MHCKHWSYSCSNLADSNDSTCLFLTKRRDTSTVISDMLTVIRNGASQNQVLTKAKVGYVLAKKYLSYLCENQYVECKIDTYGRQKFFLTNEGDHWREILAEHQKRMNRFFGSRTRPTFEPILQSIFYNKELEWDHPLPTKLDSNRFTD